MLRCSSSKFLYAFKRIGINHTTYRHVRKVSRREFEPKLLKGRVVTAENDDLINNFAEADNYDDFKNKMKRLFVEEDELKMEEALTNNEDYSLAIVKADCMHDMAVMDEKLLKRKIKRNIVKRKYFKNEMETNLLTCAAKKQIRYLHQLDPLEWTLERLSESFPISVTGVKKLLKNNFVHSSPEAIKAHDAEVAERWKILKSGKFSPRIKPATQLLWNQGKLQQDNFAGNTTLPDAPITDSNRKLNLTTKQDVGEHLAIVQRFLDYKKNQIAVCEKKTNTELDTNLGMRKIKLDTEDIEVRKDVLPKLRLRYPSADELEDQISASYLAAKKPEPWEPEIPHSQFTENLKDELSMKSSSKTTSRAEYRDWIEKEEARSSIHTPKKPLNTSDVFTKIQKYERNTMELKRDTARQHTVYHYDENSGYQYPVGKTIKGRIRIPSKAYKKGSLYQVEQSIYDENGEFLYRLPYK